ncbi:MAG: vanadium-dependent haloperoxidase [Pseudomonadota bacterium]
MAKNRIEESYRARLDAAEMARARAHPTHAANPDEQRYASAHYPMSFTKGLHHDVNLGVVESCAHFEAFRSAIDAGYIEPFTTRVPVPVDGACCRRQWEAPTAGLVYDLQGPDAQAVTMAPAPALCSDELTFEMAEVYELALLRDVPLTSFGTGGGDGETEIDDAIARMNALPYADDRFDNRPRTTESGSLTRQTVFRGASPGVEIGPYLSQLMWIGNGDPADGVIGYGPQCIDQKVRAAVEGLDYMQHWDDWYRVQQGFDVNHCGAGKGNETPCGIGQRFEQVDGEDVKRFICTPRDLATYVHVDALYQAYLNAALILLGMRSPFDPGFAKLSGMRDVYAAQPGMAPIGAGAIDQNAGGFALYGGPHILTLVTEVATRALKAVRFQKFNTHLRLRPEALGARVYCAAALDAAYPTLCGAFTKMRTDMADTVAAVESFNEAAIGQATTLLPMAFAEGSPMHPTYGAGHATVAGACVTVLKAYFDTGAVLGVRDAPDDTCADGQIGFHTKIREAVYYAPPKDGSCLEKKHAPCPLTLEGELNKLAANISIGRNMAGVHYFSDYYDSVRMGEEIAIGMLQEQALCYPTDDFVMSVPTFDGEIVRIGAK